MGPEFWNADGYGPLVWSYRMGCGSNVREWLNENGMRMRQTEYSSSDRIPRVGRAAAQCWAGLGLVIRAVYEGTVEPATYKQNKHKC